MEFVHKFISVLFKSGKKPHWPAWCTFPMSKGRKNDKWCVLWICVKSLSHVISFFVFKSRMLWKPWRELQRTAVKDEIKPALWSLERTQQQVSLLDLCYLSSLITFPNLRCEKQMIVTHTEKKTRRSLCLLKTEITQVGEHVLQHKQVWKLFWQLKIIKVHLFITKFTFYKFKNNYLYKLMCHLVFLVCLFVFFLRRL